mgnify:CR=1 FL=1
MVQRYIKLKRPTDIMAYAQRLTNQIRREELELDPKYLGKLILLLQLWISAYKANLESIEVEEFKKQLAELRQQIIEINKNAGSMEKP